MNKLKQTWEYLCKHKYAITVLIFLLIIGVLDDENSLIQRVSHKKEIRELNAEIKKYRDQYEKDSHTLKELISNPEELEKIAREKYLMNQPDEDIFIFEEDLEKNKNE